MATRTDTLLNRNPRTPHLLNMQRGKAGELNQLWLELDHALQAMEGRVGTPEIERIAVSTLSVLNGGGVNDGILVEGRGFIPVGWYRAMVAINPGLNMGIEWWASQPGADGNNLRIVYVKGGGGLAVAYNPATRTETVTLAAGGSTPAAIIAAIAADPASYAVVNPANVFGSTGLGVVNVAMAATALTGGQGTTLRTATLTVDPAGANNGIVYVARTAGPSGNLITVAYTVGAPGSAATVTVSGMDISIAVDAATTTALQVIAAVNNHAVARKLVHAYRMYGDNGTGTFAGAVAAANLSNGADGQGLKAWAGGKAGAVFAITDTTALVSFGAMAESAKGELALLEIDICGNAFRFPITMAA